MLAEYCFALSMKNISSQMCSIVLLVCPKVQYLFPCSSSFTKMILYRISTLPYISFADDVISIYIMVENPIQSSVVINSDLTRVYIHGHL